MSTQNHLQRIPKLITAIALTAPTMPQSIDGTARAVGAATQYPNEKQQDAPAGMARLKGIFPRAVSTAPIRKSRIHKTINRMLTLAAFAVAALASAAPTTWPLNIHLRNDIAIRKFAVNHTKRVSVNHVGAGWFRGNCMAKYSTNPKYGRVSARITNRNLYFACTRA